MSAITTLHRRPVLYQAVSFGVSRNDSNNDILSSRTTSGDAPLPEILDMGMDTGKEEEISVANAR